MLTRLRVRGFKNLHDVEVRFGPFTCIAGANAVGKSNLFDAILLLASLADTSLLEAALSVRDKAGKSSDVEGLFGKQASGSERTISFEADLLLPRHAVDDLGQTATPATTFVTYSLELGLVKSKASELRPGLQILHESLDYVPITGASSRLGKWHANSWLKSVVSGRRTSPFISTLGGGASRIIRLHQDGTSGRAKEFRAGSLPRTVLSTVNGVESPTALVARREMQSWKLLQLEPTALRAPDTFNAPPQLGADGSHLPSTLYALSRQADDRSAALGNRDVVAMVGARLAELVDDVRSVHIERDDRRELLTLCVEDTSGRRFPARALSDGTLRFIALTVMEADSNARGVLCFEEPENGIHPARIPAMIRLLRDLAVDTKSPVDLDNPLRQVIVNTHSPAVVSQVPAESLLFAERFELRRGTVGFSVVFRPVEGTWRSAMEGATAPVHQGAIVEYLNPLRRATTNVGDGSFERVVDRPLIAQLLLWGPRDESSAND